MDLGKQLRQHGYKLTQPRRLISQVLQANQHRLLSVEAIYEALGRAIDLSTVYRNIEIFDDCGLIHKVQSDDKAMYKLICQADHHHHLICLDCGATTVIDYCPLPQLHEIAEAHQFSVSGHTLEVFGRCQACRSKTADDES